MPPQSKVELYAAIRRYARAGMSMRMVRAHAAERREENRPAEGHGGARAFVPRSPPPGAEAEADCGGVTIRLSGEPVERSLFSFRLSCSGESGHLILASGGQARAVRHPAMPPAHGQQDQR